MNRKTNIERDLTFDEWNTLPFETKREIWNHYWNPCEPEIGRKTKKEIIERFSNDLKIDFEQIGIGSFGFGVYMLFVIVKDSKTRVSKKFSDIPVNKGVIQGGSNNQKVIVKFDYGGTMEIDLTEKMKIK